MRSFNSFLGFKSPSTVSSLFNGRRNITPNLARRISQSLNLDAVETRYLELICQIKNETDENIKSGLIDMVQELRPDLTYYSYGNDIFKTMKNWYHMTILTAGRLNKFKEGLSQTLHKRLRGNLAPIDIKQALERLERLGFVSKDGTSFKTNEKVSFGDKLPDLAIREYHKQSLELAKTAIDEQNMSERDLRASTFGIKEDDYQKAIELIKKCHSQLLELESEDADHIYQINTQFFQLTKKTSGDNK
jgi:uncharacterized protein (TIGR02147 family)